MTMMDAIKSDGDDQGLSIALEKSLITLTISYPSILDHVHQLIHRTEKIIDIDEITW